MSKKVVGIEWTCCLLLLGFCLIGCRPTAQNTAATPGSTQHAFAVKGISDVKIDVETSPKSAKSLCLYIGDRNWSSGTIGGGENVLATLEVSDQIQLEDGTLGHGIIFSRQGGTSFLAITKDGQIPYGKAKIRQADAIVQTPDAITVADIESEDGTRTPISLKLV